MNQQEQPNNLGHRNSSLDLHLNNEEESFLIAPAGNQIEKSSFDNYAAFQKDQGSPEKENIHEKKYYPINQKSDSEVKIKRSGLTISNQDMNLKEESKILGMRDSQSAQLDQIQNHLEFSMDNIVLGDDKKLRDINNKLVSKGKKESRKNRLKDGTEQFRLSLQNHFEKSSIDNPRICREDGKEVEPKKQELYDTQGPLETMTETNKHVLISSGKEQILKPYRAEKFSDQEEEKYESGTVGLNKEGCFNRKSSLDDQGTHWKGFQYKKPFKTDDYDISQHSQEFHVDLMLLDRAENEKHFMHKNLDIANHSDLSLKSYISSDAQSNSESGQKLISEIVILLGNTDIKTGDLLLKFKKYEEAAKVYKTIVNTKIAELIEALLKLGNVQLIQKEYQESVETFERATIIDTSCKEAYNNWGIALNRLHRDQEAVEKFERAIIIDSSYKEAYNNLGIALNELERYQEAAVKFERATIIDPSFKEAYFSWGNSFFKQRKYPEASEKYERAIIIDPAFKEAYLQWGNSLIYQLKYQEAEEKFQRVTIIDPNYLEPSLNRQVTLAVDASVGAMLFMCNPVCGFLFSIQKVLNPSLFIRQVHQCSH